MIRSSLPYLRACLAVLSLLWGSLSAAVIYGSDDRKDIHEVPSLRRQASAVAVTVANNFIEDLNSTQVRIKDTGTFAKNINVCLTEKFSTQPVFDIGTCTGFLIGDRYLLTAGHCILPNGIVDSDPRHPFCEAFSWYFDFNTAANPQTTEQIISKNKLYGCSRIIRAENINGDDNNPDHDFALIELDRKVEGVVPLNLRVTPAILSERVYAIGHPFGLPAKYSGPSPIHDVTLVNTFAVNLDTFGGNSGSPVFDIGKNVLGILISGHPVDLATLKKNRCQNANRCDASGHNCLENSKFKGLPTSNFVQRLAPIVEFLPKVLTSRP